MSVSPGMIQINGKYQQTATGILRIGMAGLDSGQFDILQIDGDATLAGRVELAFSPGFVLKPGDSVEFLKVSGKLTGTLDVVPQIIPADSGTARPALAVQAKMTLAQGGRASLTLTDVRPTVQFNVALDPNRQGKVQLSFVPVAGSNHFIEFRGWVCGRLSMAAISRRAAELRTRFRPGCNCRPLLSSSYGKLSDN